MNDRLLDELLAAIHAVLPSAHPSLGVKLFAASLGGNRRIHNLGTVWAKAYGWVCFSVVKVRTWCDVHLFPQ